MGLVTIVVFSHSELDEDGLGRVVQLVHDEVQEGKNCNCSEMGKSAEPLSRCLSFYERRKKRKRGRRREGPSDWQRKEEIFLFLKRRIRRKSYSFRGQPGRHRRLLTLLLLLPLSQRGTRPSSPPSFSYLSSLLKIVNGNQSLG